MHRFKPGLMAALLSVAVMACSGGGGTAGNVEASPKAGGNLVFTVATEPSTMNPVLGVNQDRIVATAFVDRFVGTDSKGLPAKTGIATGWSQPDPSTWRFTMKSGITFQNGEPLDAAAVVASIGTVQKETGSLKALFAIITSSTAPDATTVEVKTKIATNAIPALFTSLWLFPPKYYAQAGGKGFGTAPVGSGPFKFQSWTPGKSIKASRNDAYWRGKPYLDSITWTFAPDDSTRLGLLSTGGASVVQNLTAAQQKTVAADKSLRVQRVATTGTMALGIPIASGTMSDVNLRKALAMAIDRKSIVNAIFGGDGVGASSQSTFFPPIFGTGPTYPDSLGYDAAKAQSLVKAAGSTPSINLTYTTNRYTSDTDVGEAVAGMLEKAGFKVTRKPLDGVTFFSTVNNTKSPYDSPFIFTYVAVYPHPDVLVHTFLTSDATLHFFCPDPKLDAMSNAGLSAKSDAEQRTAYSQLEDRVLNTDVCWVPLYNVILAYGVSNKVHNFGAQVDQLVDYYPTWIS